MFHVFFCFVTYFSIWQLTYYIMVRFIRDFLMKRFKSNFIVKGFVKLEASQWSGSIMYLNIDVLRGIIFNNLHRNSKKNSITCRLALICRTGDILTYPKTRLLLFFFFWPIVLLLKSVFLDYFCILPFLMVFGFFCYYLKGFLKDMLRCFRKPFQLSFWMFLWGTTNASNCTF